MTKPLARYPAYHWSSDHSTFVTILDNRLYMVSLWGKGWNHHTRQFKSHGATLQSRPFRAHKTDRFHREDEYGDFETALATAKYWMENLVTILVEEAL